MLDLKLLRRFAGDTWEWLTETILWPCGSYRDYRIFKRISDYERIRLFRHRLLIAAFAVVLMLIGLIFHEEMREVGVIGLIFYVVGALTQRYAAILPFGRKLT